MLPFQIPLKVWSWLAFLSWTLAFIPDLTKLVGIDLYTLPGVVSKALIAVGALSLSYRKLKDDNHNGIPDIFEPGSTLPPSPESKADAKAVILDNTVTR